MNPFDLAGPQFLLFYAVLFAVALVLLRRRPAGGQATEPISDPYELAFLRSGAGEVIRVGLLSLLDRRLLKAAGGKLAATGPSDVARRPIERALLDRFATETGSAGAYGDSGVSAAVGAIQKDLRARGHLNDDAELARQRRRRNLSAGVLLAVALTRLLVALSRGRHNVIFLVLSAAVAVVVVAVVGRPSAASPRGAGSLARAQGHFARLRQRAGDLVPGGETNELALLMSLFGLAGLPPLARDLLVEAHVARAPAGAGSSCGSSCGASSGSSCSSSDGGSSCSSGCGGCGGGGCS